jgi:hypothetical protein
MKKLKRSVETGQVQLDQPLGICRLLKECGRLTLINMDDALVHRDLQRLEQMQFVAKLKRARPSAAEADGPMFLLCCF